MHHMYPLAKGDPLCPLGFHPQVRWPTRCKRCFRDYKEHGGKKREDTSLRRDTSTASSPSLSYSLSDSESSNKRNWVSTTNLNYDQTNSKNSNINSLNDTDPPSSWISTPDLANLQDDTQPIMTVNVKLPKRKQKPIEAGHRTVSDSVSLIREKSPIYNKSDSLATRAKKLQALKEAEQTISSTSNRRIQIKEVKTISEEPHNHDVQFLIQVKRKIAQDDILDGSASENDDTASTTCTDTTDTTLVGVDSDLTEQLESMKKELEVTKAKCERLERDKSDILLRRLAAMETTTSKTSASEVLKLQKKCNEFQQLLEDYKDEKRSLSLKVKELEVDLDMRPTAQEAQKVADELRSKLLAAESLCEELMDENEDIKKELRDIEEQMDEMQDNFREDQAVEYTSIKKELDQTTKNCRILSFKLRKAERRSEQLETEKSDFEKKLKDVTGGSNTLNQLDKIKHLEQELKVSNEVSVRLQKELEEANQRLSKAEQRTPTKKKAPLLGNIGKTPSNEKVSRESLTRGGSQDDPAQLLRDLQDSLEREADLREQLKFAEEEADNLRKKVSRIEDDNESLVLQLKKMATRAKSRKLSPTNKKLAAETHSKSYISDDDDPTEVKLQLELSEQEASVLRKKVEELEADSHRLKSKVKDLQDKLASKNMSRRTILGNDNSTALDNQKFKILEDETNDLRKKLIEKERDCERLHAELSLNQKRPKSIQRSKSLDMDQHTLDLKRQLQVIEQEAAILRSKIQSLETENEKLLSENKKLNLLKNTRSVKSDKSIDKYIDKIASLEIELNDSLKKIKELELALSKTSNIDLHGDYKKFSQRTSKRVTALTSRDQLKTIVSDLEKEISEILQAMKQSENEKIKLEEEIRKMKNCSEIENALKELAEINKKYDTVRRELEEEKDKTKKEISHNEDLALLVSKTKESLETACNEKKKLKEQIDKMDKEHRKINEERKHLDDEIIKLKQDLKNIEQDKIEISQRSETLKILLKEKNEQLNKLQHELEETNKSTFNDASTKEKRITELEFQLNKFESKYNECDRKMKELSKDLETKIEKNKAKLKLMENEQKQWEEEKSKFIYTIEELNMQVKGLENTIEQKNKHIKQLEDSLIRERDIVAKTNTKAQELETREIGRLKDDLSKKEVLLSELESKLEITHKTVKNLEEKIKKSELNNKNSKLETEKKAKELEIDLQNERKKLEVLKTTNEKEQKNRELELTSLKNKIKKLELGGGVKKELELKHFQEAVENLENAITTERQKYDELTAKYEILEEEHVVTKAKLIMEKETLENQYTNLSKEVGRLEIELRKNQSNWGKERDELENKIKHLQRTSSNNSNDYEKQRLKALFEEKQSDLEQLRKEYDAIHDQMEYMRRENDDLNKKLDDYEKVNKIQRNISADTSAMEKEIRQLKLKLQNSEKNKKSDVTECKMRYESQIKMLNGELQSLQNQVIRFKREKDTYRHMLESAQKTIGELKQLPGPGGTPIIKSKLNYDELDEAKTKIATLEQQINCMEDELSEARLECSRLKTELISERSSWEVKLAELHSKVNELEEEKVLNSGRTKIVGLRTKMELAWQKEREEQQRLLQETATLARDLRQTLFEVERERDKERLEAKRKHDQFKRSYEEEQDETKRKITELQCDLLELRDAHAKLRTTNEKLRREKERYDKDREENRIVRQERIDKRKSNSEDNKKVNAIIEQIDNLKQLAPELFFSKENEAPYTPTPPRRTKSKSRETSPALEKRDSSLSPEDKQQNIQYIMQKLVRFSEDLRKFQPVTEDDMERERLRRSMGMRRATSSEADSTQGTLKYNTLARKSSVTSYGSLQRKSLSLEHTTQPEQSIWKGDDSLSSLHSLEISSDIDRSRRDASLDSRLSGSSTQSDIGEKKKKKGLIGKLKKLTKSRSIDDQDPGTFSPTRSLLSKPNSNADINEERGSKKDLKERISGIFKKSGSSSRSNSVERKHETSSTQRPLIRNDSNGNVSSQSYDTNRSRLK